MSLNKTNQSRAGQTPSKKTVFKQRKKQAKNSTLRSFNTNDRSDDDDSNGDDNSDDNNDITNDNGSVVDGGQPTAGQKPGLTINVNGLSPSPESPIDVVSDPYHDLDGVGDTYVPKPRTESERNILTRDRLNTEGKQKTKWWCLCDMRKKCEILALKKIAFKAFCLNGGLFFPLFLVFNVQYSMINDK